MTTPGITLLDAERFAELVTLGTRAPSLHNTQPWLFHRDGDAVEVFADPSRVLPATDPSGWGQRIAIGAAAYNLRLGYAQLGWRAETEPFPEAGEKHLVVRVHPVAEHRITPAERTVADAIPRRHTNRRPYLEAPVPAATLAALVHAADEEACRLTVLDARGVGEVSELIRDADAELERRRGYREELRRWCRDAGGPPDGVRWDRLTGRPHADERLRRRDFGAPTTSSDRRYESDPCLAVLTSSGDGRFDELRAGQALQHVLLRATSAGLTSSLYSQPIEVGAVRQRLSAVCGGGTPQMVVRVGYGLAHGPTPRRPIDEVIR
ncbi:Acg family FMN-binding oxidoreductase [Cryptosporangium arvum]|uniref:Nitroreductase family oxidoreductase n=1 Tax=Cryptosporangium arvum DSM 44712 TaxID=927661 RepID=A0A010ZZ48_9ACTN|nr:nitroreductase family protein [Cryptosporangium arvum]EXG82492.1 nitroreductase family oxidoreductase [Cryptosporangium arvum DSM 44712]